MHVNVHKKNFWKKNKLKYFDAMSFNQLIFLIIQSRSYPKVLLWSLIKWCLISMCLVLWVQEWIF